MIGANTNDLNQLVQNQGFADLHEFAKIRLGAWLRACPGQSDPMSLQEMDFESCLKRLGPEIHKGRYPGKHGLTDEMRIEIEEICGKFAVSFSAYVQAELEIYVREQYRSNSLLTNYFSKKYGSETPSALAQTGDSTFGLIEQEDDMEAWSRAAESMAYFENLINVLRK